ncbi:alanine racemase [Loigolactobacillus jiayinensis]|uniref:Alanine racemase n=1 Tax=Loigolactobacillus jiayinensis TaxID=2486016 RepID=A0ABW1RJU0_9LACO|nr:alanine racemase [Loigolactobacillus jiayinensis]
MVSGLHRPTKLVIDQQAIKANIQQEIQRLAPTTVLWAVVKANGYGHGMIEVATTARHAGATGFCVAILDEALALRQAGFTEPILVLGITSPAYAKLAATAHISLTVGSQEWLVDALPSLQAGQLAASLAVHFAVDSGMGRIGFRDTATLQAADTFLQQHAEFNLEGLFTHFATADEADTTYFEQQAAKFNQMHAALVSEPRYVHVSNSATSLWHAACNGNMVRFGVALYGLNPSGTALEPPYPLQPALSFESELVFVKQIQAGAAVSYGATYHAQQAEWVGTVPVGYADGWQRRLQGFYVLINGQACEIIGRVCMDQLMVRLPEKLAVGTKVTLVGENGGQTLSLQNVADYANTIHYEIACNLTERVPRVYLPEK